MKKLIILKYRNLRANFDTLARRFGGFCKNRQGVKASGCDEQVQIQLPNFPHSRKVKASGYDEQVHYEAPEGRAALCKITVIAVILLMILGVLGSTIYADDLFNTAELSQQIKEQVNKLLDPLAENLGVGLGGNIDYTAETPKIFSAGINLQVVKIKEEGMFADATNISIPYGMLNLDGSLLLLKIPVEIYIRLLPAIKIDEASKLSIFGFGAKYRILKDKNVPIPLPAVKIIAGYHQLKITRTTTSTNAQISISPPYNINLETVISKKIPVTPFTFYIGGGINITRVPIDGLTLPDGNKYTGYTKTAFKAKAGIDIAMLLLHLNYAYNFAPIASHELGLHLRF